MKPFVFKVSSVSGNYRDFNVTPRDRSFLILLQHMLNTL